MNDSPNSDRAPDRVYRLIPGATWRAALTDGGDAAVIPWAEVDRNDGFLHLSARAQVAQTARLHYADVADLTVLEIDAAALGDTLRWEASRGGALFPHVYGQAPASAVIDARAFDADEFT